MFSVFIALVAVLLLPKGKKGNPSCRGKDGMLSCLMFGNQRCLGILKKLYMLNLNYMLKVNYNLKEGSFFSTDLSLIYFIFVMV